MESVNWPTVIVMSIIVVIAMVIMYFVINYVFHEAAKEGDRRAVEALHKEFVDRVARLELENEALREENEAFRKENERLKQEQEE